MNPHIPLQEVAVMVEGLSALRQRLLSLEQAQGKGLVHLEAGDAAYRLLAARIMQRSVEQVAAGESTVYGSAEEFLEALA